MVCKFFFFDHQKNSVSRKKQDGGGFCFVFKLISFPFLFTLILPQCMIKISLTSLVRNFFLHATVSFPNLFSFPFMLFFIFIFFPCVCIVSLSPACLGISVSFPSTFLYFFSRILPYIPAPFTYTRLTTSIFLDPFQYIRITVKASLSFLYHLNSW